MKTLRCVAVGMLLVAGCAAQVAPPAAVPLASAQAGRRIELERVTIPSNGYRGILAYFRDGNIYILNLETGEHTRYRGVPTMDYPEWHRDGERIVFGYGQIHLLQVQTGAITHLSDGTRLQFENPSWTPDENQILFLRVNGQTPGLQMLDVLTSTSRMVNLVGITLPDDFEVSPDGQTLLFSANSQIYTASMTCIADQRATNCPVTQLTDRTLNARTPRWSPNGEQIVFYSFDTENQVESLYLMNSNGSDLQRLTPSDYRAAEPAWSPDGQFIAFAQYGGQAGQGQLCIFNVAEQDFSCIFNEEVKSLDWWMPPASLNATPEPTSEATETTP